MARTYNQLHPKANMIILDSTDSVGGVWSSDRLYPGLKTNNLLGSYENPDLSMSTEAFEVKRAQHIPGPVVHNYLNSFAEHFDLLRLVLYRHNVDRIEEQALHSPGNWQLTVTRPSSTGGISEVVQFTTDKLVIAAGVTAYANMPSYHGSKLFKAPIFHAKEFRQRQGLLQTAKRVVVCGGAKSAWDGVYAYATSGVQVDWVIRKSGKGPCWMAPAFAADGSWIENTVVTRFFTIFQPTLWSQKDGFDWLRWLLHSTLLGRYLCNMFWSSFEKMIVGLNGYDKHPETQKLRPWSGVFWAGTTLSILNYPTDFFELLRTGKVRVHHAEITHLDENCTVVLSDGTRLSNVDALHCSTGWKHEPSIIFSPPSLAQRLGLPVKGEPTPPSVLTARADATVLSRFPILCRQPNITPKRGKTAEAGDLHHVASPYRLYRWAVPPAYWEKQNIAIIGTFLSLGQAVSAQCQALWVSSFLDGDLSSQMGLVKPLTIEEIEWETELQTQFHRLRTPAGCGDRHGEFTFETLPFYDLLLRDMGIKTQRKPTWWKDKTEPHGPADYKGLVDDYIKAVEERKTRMHKEERIY